MAERTNRSRIERLKYGICLNEECEKCKTKEIQQIPMRRDFVCASCGKELRECPPPKKSSKGKITAVVIILAIIIAAIIAYTLSGNTSTEEKKLAPTDSTAQPVATHDASEDSLNTRSDTVINTSQSSDVKNLGSKTVRSTVKVTETTITTKSTKSTVKRVSNGGGRSTLKLSYGTYTGEVRNGYPNGMGRLTYSKSRKINRNDSKGRTASAGDYVIGEFVNGFFVQGKHYGSDGNLIESIIVGVSADDAYESK